MARTFGWVQNPNRLDTLKKVVSIFDKNTEYNRFMREYRLPLLLINSFISKSDFDEFRAFLNNPVDIPYNKLKGKGAGSLGRKNALCTGIVQASIDAQSDRTVKLLNGRESTIKKPYTDDWTADGYMRWAISTGLIKYDRQTDTCSITNLGKRLAMSEDESQQEANAFTEALLSYPPCIRILSELSNGEEMTKFELGCELGFSGEMGFTSIPQNMFVADYCSQADPKIANRIRSNTEGDSDKYARTIANWMVQMNWITTTKKRVTELFMGKCYSMDLMAYKITLEGIKALKRANGYSSNPRIPRIVMYEMLATKAPDTDYIRYRRALIIKSIHGRRQGKTAEGICQYLHNNGIEESVSTIKDDIKGLSRIGLDIIKIDDVYVLNDKINELFIPTSTVERPEVSELKEQIREKLNVLDHKYLILVDLAYSDASTTARKNADAREFEIETADLFTRELNFNGMRLGDADKPDVIISFNENGTIIDNKSYKNGFSVDKHNADEMTRYINQNARRSPGIPSNEWWRNFDESVCKFTFLFVTSFLKGNFKNNLEEIATLTGVNGGAIAVDNLLYIAEDIKSGAMAQSDFFKIMNNNEITVN